MKSVDLKSSILVVLFLLVSILSTYFLARATSHTSDTSVSLPDTQAPEFADIEDIKQRKKAFFEFFNHLVEQKNQQIEQQRQRIQSLRQAQAMDKRDEEWLIDLAKSHRITLQAPPSEQDWALILEKVDIIPSSLVLAQAAIESAWGTSRFAKEGNNFFGQWCFKKGCGLVPSSRSSDASHEVKTFDAPGEAVDSYFRNINSHPAYTQLRTLRAKARKHKTPISGCQLAAGLSSYSAKGIHYINEIRQLIRFNKLSKPESAQHCRSIKPKAPDPIPEESEKLPSANKEP